MNILQEDRRSELIAQGKRGEKEKGDGKSRYEKRVKSNVSHSTREYNQIDMNSLFKNNILTVSIPVRGETNNYLVKIKFGGFLDILKDFIDRQNGVFNLRAVTRALIDSFNSDDVYIHCSCPDFKYRMAYWASINDLNSGEAESRPSNITNPKDNLGPGCKHVMLVLSNTNWLIKVASVINNYVKFFEQRRKKEYADIIYPAIYGKPYEEPVQLSIDDTDELVSDTDTIDTANIQGAVSGRFKAGNPYRFKSNDSQIRGQTSIDDIEQQSSEETEEPEQETEREAEQEDNAVSVSDELEYQPDDEVDDENTSISDINHDNEDNS